jgi:hypothetical protein
MRDLDKIDQLDYALDSIMRSRAKREDTHLNIAAGWYQSIKGSLYHYDGVVWDEVPDLDIEQLEYLG